MPSQSLSQNRFVRAMAAEGKPWAKKWVAEQHGHKVPHIEHVKHALKRRHRRKHGNRN